MSARFGICDISIDSSAELTHGLSFMSGVLCADPLWISVIPLTREEALSLFKEVRWDAVEPSEDDLKNIKPGVILIRLRQDVEDTDYPWEFCIDRDGDIHHVSFLKDESGIYIHDNHHEPLSIFPGMNEEAWEKYHKIVNRGDVIPFPQAET